MKNLLLSAAASALALGAASSANAAVVFNSLAYDVAPAPGETIALDFESTTPPAGYTITTTNPDPNSNYHTGTIAGIAAAPALDATQYYAVGGGQSATITFPLPLRSFSLYVGSIDSYNTLVFDTSTGTFTLTGGDLTATPNGDQGDAATNRRYFFNTDDGATINSVTFSSGANAFEFDNLATSAVPEVATWLMMIAGFGMIGTALRRRKVTTTVRYA